MAKKRMFSLSVVDTDNFLEMPISSRLLYYELGMRADDDGFVDDWKKILLFTGLKDDDMKILIAKKFIIPFESGIIVIRHWRLNNYLQKDRTTPTIYQDEFKRLEISKNGQYFEKVENIPKIVENKGSASICIQSVYNDEKTDSLEEQQKSTEIVENKGSASICIHSIDKYSIDKYNNNILINKILCRAETDNVSEKDSNNTKVCKEIIDYLNLKANKHFKYTQNNCNRIKTRLKEGFKKEDFIVVIDKKVNEWLNDSKMSIYLRPETLFGNKFEGYLNQETKMTIKNISLNSINKMIEAERGK